MSPPGLSKKTLFLLQRKWRMRSLSRWRCPPWARIWRCVSRKMMQRPILSDFPYQVVDQHGVINIDAEDVGNPQLVSLVNNWHLLTLKRD